MKNKWFKLDNAGKIFPPTSSKKDPKVFRFSCELKEDVDSFILQSALDETIETFPGFKVILRKGLFWYYLEETDIKSLVSMENDLPCSSIYNNSKNTLLFRVNYYKKRVNLEVYHALTDGTGALEFLRVLISYYISKKYFENDKVLIDYDASYAEKMSDSFDKYFENKKLSKTKIPNSYQIKAGHINNNRIVEGHLSVNDVLNKAHEYNATLTTFLTSIYILSIAKTMATRDKKDPISIVIPVNLRKYFKSATARNFFSTITVSYYSNKKDTLKDIINIVNSVFDEELNPNKIQDKLNEYSVFEHNFIIRLVPLFFKDIALYIAYLLSEKRGTAALSNIGIVKINEKYQDYINLFSVFVSTYKEQICLCSYLDTLTIASTSSFEDTDIMMNFYRELSNMNIEIEIVSNIVD